MNEKDFKGFEDLKVMRNDGMTFWAFKGENVWSRDIVELWKWVELAKEKIKGLRFHPFDIKFGANDLD